MGKKRFSVLFSISLCLIVSLGLLLGCSGSQGSSARPIKGVGTDDGNVYVTFQLPSGASLEKVLGSSIGTVHTLGVGTMGGNGSTIPDLVQWATVGKGGIVSWQNDVYRYAPTAKVTDKMGGPMPPAYALLYKVPAKAALFDPSDTDLLKENYGISLNL